MKQAPPNRRTKAASWLRPSAEVCTADGVEDGSGWSRHLLCCIKRGRDLGKRAPKSTSTMSEATTSLSMNPARAHLFPLLESDLKASSHLSLAAASGGSTAIAWTASSCSCLIGRGQEESYEGAVALSCSNAAFTN